MGCTLRLILGDQLTATLPVITDAVKTRDILLMAEVKEEATYVKHHKKKIAFLFSAMRHFAEELKDDGFKVNYRKYDDPDNQGSLLNEVKALVSTHDVDNIVVTEPGEYRLLKSMQQWESQLGVPVDLLPDERFYASKARFAEWAEGRKTLRMEFWYREMRKETGILMENGAPAGGDWNYDAKNRESMPASVTPPPPVKFEPDEITRDVISLVEKEFGDHFGELDDFHYAIDRAGALEVLNRFIDERLPDFGRYQDAMRHNMPWLFHSHLSFYINCGLLSPREVVQQAEAAWHAGEAPLNSVEGFIRQIIGWREFVRGFYWHYMPGLQTDNYFNAKRTLPDFFWDGYTNMNCLRQCITDTKKHAYAHHIQRLMVLGNFSLLCELSPAEVQEWYLLVYADAYEWVELPNVSGMILFADGGNLASKPYVASGSYINKMSDYCKHCGYSVSKKSGEGACPFNYLYWRFLDAHQDKLRKNPRMALVYKSYDRMAEEKIAAMREDGQRFLTKLSKNEEV
ncbi:cryptochrome/photolyase family protein [Alteromonas sp. RKMC-009]|uniref:cryptochrome/photolyase family protein n=1 Tax=Alteromonas sp. RKMC-009 TaxID=2267264 RepID=UPI000E6A3DDE|nr:cryptochrome/photolyase family protein [Alteromonas sp. RKMC-009]AYA64502.1 cryptochrome/photolyase family protein [Alteromonas sp. RKMC-009]